MSVAGGRVFDAKLVNNVILRRIELFCKVT